MATDLTYSGQAKVYKTQGGTGLIIESGGQIDASAGTVIMPGALAKGYIDLGPYLFGARELASAENFIDLGSSDDPTWGGILAGGGTGTTPSMSLTASGDQSFYLGYASAVVDGLKLPPIFMPGDMSTVDGITIGLYGETVGTATAADAKQAFDIRAWMDIGDTEMGATHADFTSTPAFQSITLASGDVSTGILNLTLVPAAHAGRAIRLYGGRISYTKKTS